MSMLFYVAAFVMLAAGVTVAIVIGGTPQQSVASMLRRTGPGGQRS